MKKDPKILVLSISSWNSKVGSNTWPLLLEMYNPNSIANISLRDEYPDSKVANHYFVISEAKILKSIFNHNTITGHKVGAVQSSEEIANQNLHVGLYKKRGFKFFYRIMREIVWKLGNWKTKELKSFLLEFKPDVILYSMDGYIHFNSICHYVKRFTSAKSIGFFVDDNFTYKQSNNILFNIFRYFQKRSLKKLVKYTDAFWSITQYTQKEVLNVFNVESTIITKPSNVKAVFHKSVYTKPYKILYAGNLGIGRDLSLRKVIKALRILNRDSTYFILDIYTNTKLRKRYIKKYESDFCHFHSAIEQSKILMKYKDYDLLLFLEAIAGPNKKISRLSFSTKIVDYLSSARCIFAVGARNNAPIEYFIEKKCAFVSSSTREIINNFKVIISDNTIMNLYAKNAYNCALNNHNPQKIHKAVDKSIKNVLGED